MFIERLWSIVVREHHGPCRISLPQVSVCILHDRTPLMPLKPDEADWCGRYRYFLFLSSAAATSCPATIVPSGRTLSVVLTWAKRKG